MCHQLLGLEMGSDGTGPQLGEPDDRKGHEGNRSKKDTPQPPPTRGCAVSSRDGSGMGAGGVHSRKQCSPEQFPDVSLPSSASGPPLRAW